MSELIVAAVDLGAESGRVAAAHFDGTRIDLELVNRFANTPSETDGWLRWNTDSLWNNIADGLATLGGRATVASVGVDTWGLDYGLYRNGELLDDPVTYRDAHHVEAFERAVAEFGADRLYSATGIQLIEINSLFGMLADAHERPSLLGDADLLLMMPDVFHHRLSGARVTEFSAASTTGMYDMASKGWARGLLADVGLPEHFLPEVADAGTDVGGIAGELARGGLAKTRVILPSAHDTSSAVLAIPNAGPDTLFISSGTWSLVGVVLDEPIVTRESRLLNLTNEGGYDGSVRFLRNVMGLWVLQECRRQWQREGIDVDYETLVRLADAVTPLQTVIDLNATEFLAPGDMPGRIRAYCASRGIRVPATMGEMARTIIDSLALSYRLVMEDIEQLTGVPITSVAVVGGGGQNALLQQATASATGLPVVCWAKEATALGNAAAQLRALGELDSVEQIWEVVSASTQTRSFSPLPSSRWDDAATQLRELERREAARRGLGDSEKELTTVHHQAGAQSPLPR
ncbi:rhamnulokinase family protein [Subtercola sp. Z020]|uniref:rhamnulokinase n=1 Tax=Subtercola sp. Z020 TaxID=2080582 RepID=UPI00130E723A|nr:rhamnulokinase family protein [Subtercola sp. Z020]